MDIFLVFKIGSKVQKDLKESNIIIQQNSFKEFKTEILRKIERDEIRKVKRYRETEIHASYNMLKVRYLEIEVW